MMKSSTICLFACILASANIHAGSTSLLPVARLTVETVDECNQPLSNMPVHVWLSESSVRDGRTDTTGLFVAEGPCTEKDVPILIRQEGYYETRLRYSFPNYQSVENHKWQPWNPVVKAVVRRIVNPIPMYAKRVHVVIPVLNQPIGFDLVHGDWINPYGAGQVADMHFLLRKRFAGIRDFESSLDLTLTNCVDGIQETSLAPFACSAFRLARMGPLSGYAVSKLHFAESSTNYFRPDKNQSYYFRVRTETNASGQVVSARYGKISQYIGFDVRYEDTGVIIFTYYLNPTPNDRNLEFDPNRNLMRHFGKGEDSPREP